MKLILSIAFVLNIIFGDAQSSISNYVGNGGFEIHFNCNPSKVSNAKYWNDLDSLVQVVPYCNVCIGNVPNNGFGFQNPRSEKAYCIADLFILNYPTTPRTYIRNRLKSNLVMGKTYCVKYFVNVGNLSSCAMDGFGAYFGDNTLDTITKAHLPLTYLTPQIFNPTNNIISDTLNWIPITGTFVATGTEKYMVIGNFKSDVNTNFNMLYATSGFTFSTINIDDVSCIPIDLPAYAGHDTTCISGTTVYLGRTRDVGIDEACMWYKLPITITPTTPAIDTAAGIWVSPTQTSTYVVRQEICGHVKWDTVIVYKDGVGLQKLSILNEDLKIFPIPASDNIELVISKKELFLGFTSYRIYNSIGQKIREEDVLFETEKTKLSTMDMPNGIYSISIINRSSEIISKRFVICR